MASESVCQINLEGLSKEDQKFVKEKVDGIVKKAYEAADLTNLNENIDQALKDFEKFLDAASKIQKRNAYINKRKQQEFVDYLLSNWEDNPSEGVMARLVGTQIETVGSRNNTGSMIDQFQNRYKNMMRSMILKEDLFNEFKSGLYDKDIYKAIYALDKNLPLDGIDDIAVRLARIVKSTQDTIRSDANKYGAFIGELDGFVVSRSHDSNKIRQNMQGWIDWMLENVDWDVSLKGLSPDARVKFLTEQVKEFASGAHVVEPLSADSSGLKGFASIAKKMSKSRQLHFKTPELEYEYGQKFGSEGLMNALVSSVESKGRSIGMMAHLGPNAEMNVIKAIDTIMEKLKSSPVLSDQAKMDKLKDTKEYLEDVIFPILTGRTMIPANEMAATVESLILAVQRTASLGGSSIASLFGDSIVNAINIGRQDGNFSSFMRGYFEYFSSLKLNLKDPEVQDILADLGVSNDYMFTHLNPRYSDDTAAITRTQRGIRSIENTFFWLNGQTYLDTHARAGAALSLAARVGNRINKTFDKLDDGYKRLFDTHEITSGEWDIARQCTHDYTGTKIIAIEKIKRLDDSVIDGYLQSQGIKPSKYQRDYARDTIINKFRTMFQDQQGYSILSADYRLRSQMFGGSKAGSGVSTLRKMFWQFKQFPMSFVQKVLGREIYSKSPMHTKIQNIAGILIATTIGGYITTSVRDLMAGKTPKEFNAALVGESFLRGGGMGIYGDFIYQLYNQKFGASSLVKIIGPTAEDGETFLQAMGGLLQGDPEKLGDNLAKLGSSNIPFSNIFYLKPIVDYAIMNSIKELISPGTLSRAEQRMKETYGQEYFMMRPQEMMLLK